ncbi:MAG: hypothetical protein J6V78_04910 [Clostridia bacterium]|nr:hypothetical protein [Clostridia bacterium]
MKTLTENTVLDICFYNSTIRELNEIIEAELLKEDADLELIDECCEILELINAEVFNSSVRSEAVHNAEAIIRKYNSQKYKKIMLSASCAVVLGALTSVTFLSGGNNKIDLGENLKGDATENIKTEYFETTSQKTTSSKNVASTTRLNQVKNLKVMQPYDNSSLVFNNRDSINLDNFYIYVEFVDGRRFSVPSSECQYEVLETADDGATTVRVTYDGFETFINVTVSVPEITTTEYDYDYDCDCDDDVFDDDYMFTEDETSVTIEETEAVTEEITMENTEEN